MPAKHRTTRTSTYLLTAILAFLGIPSGWAVHREDVIFYADFSRGATAVIASGSGEAAVEKGLGSLADGVGNSLKLAKDGKVVWKLEKNLLPKRGALEFIFKFLETGKNGTLLQVNYLRVLHSNAVITSSAMFNDEGAQSKKIAAIACQLQIAAPVTIAERSGDAQWWNAYALVHKIDTEKAGEWHHLLVAWDFGMRETTYWLDGRKALTWGVHTDVLQGDTFQIGPVGGVCAIDEVYVYRRPLSDGEAVSAFRRSARYAGAANPGAVAVHVPKAPKPPVVDGMLSVGEYETCAAAMTGFVSTLTGELASRQMLAQFVHDGTTLFLAVSDQYRPWDIRATSPNDRLTFFSDGKERCSLKPGETLTSTVSATSVLKNGRWVAELAIPLKELIDDLSRPLHLSIRRTYTQDPERTCLGICDGPYQKNQAMELTLGNDLYPSLRLVDFEGLERGQFIPMFDMASRASLNTALRLAVSSGLGDAAITENHKWGSDIWPLYWPFRRFRQGVPLDSSTCNDLLAELTANAGAPKGMRCFSQTPWSFTQGPLVDVADCGLDQKAEVWIDAGTIAGVGEGKGFSAKLRFTKPDAAVPILAEDVAVGSHGFAHDTIDTTTLPKGKYNVSATLMAADGKVVAENTLGYDKRLSIGWDEARRVGVSEKPMAPWSAIRYDGLNAEVWGRLYAFGPNGLPSRITSVGEEILASPIVVVAEVDGTPFEISKKAKWVKKDDGGGIIESVLKSGAGKLRVRTTVEYDGFTWIEIIPEHLKRLDKLTIEIPLHDSVAKFRHYYNLEVDRTDPAKPQYRYSGANYDPAESMPVGEGLVWKQFWAPFIAVLNDKCGISFCAETDRGWFPAFRNDSVAFERTGKTLTMRLNIVSSTATRTELGPVAFSLEAIPARPPPKGWRNWRWSKRAAGNHWITTSDFSGTRENAQGSVPRAKDDHGFRELCAMSERYGLRITPYQVSLDIGAGLWEERAYFDAWKLTPGRFIVGGGSGTDSFANTARMCRKSAFTDWLVVNVRDLIERCDLKSVYMDNSGLIHCGNQTHGCGFVDASGGVHYTFDVLRFREMAKRLAQVFVDEGKEPFIVWHVPHKIPQIFAFGGWCNSGENVRDDLNRLKTWDYTRALSPETMRAAFTGRPWGIASSLLSQPCDTAPMDFRKDGRLTETLMGYLLVHDVSLWSGWQNHDVVEKCFKAQIAFGLGDDDVEYLPYYEPARQYQYAPEGVLVSAFVRLGKKTLFAVLNPRDEDREVKVSFDRSSLGLAGKSLVARDLYEETVIPLQESSFACKTRGKGFRMVVLEPGDAK